MSRTKSLFAIFLIASLIGAVSFGRSDSRLLEFSCRVDAGYQKVSGIAPRECRAALLLRLGMPADRFHGQKLLFVFHRGVSCVQCVSQLSLLGRRIEEFKRLGVGIIGVCPEIPPEDVMHKFKSTLHIHFPVVANTELDLFRQFNCIDANEIVLHGLFLIDETGRVLWNEVSEHANTDIDEILNFCTPSK